MKRANPRERSTPAGPSYAIVPVKTLGEAKSRLTSALSDAMRRRLVLTMLEDVLDALSSASGVDRILVVTPDPDIGDLARREGAVVLREQRSGGLNAALSLGVAHALREGATRTLFIPADLPFASAEEISEIMAESHRSGPFSATIVADREGEGTNALLLTPPDALAPNFGPGSFERHCDQARTRAIMPRVLRLQGLGLDIDEPADLAHLIERSRDRPRYAFLREAKVTESGIKMGADES
jgi:2-phospho-L-lactate guanylyltransferase